MANAMSLEERVAALERENDRLHAWNEINNLMGQYTVNWVPKNLHGAAGFLCP